VEGRYQKDRSCVEVLVCMGTGWVCVCGKMLLACLSTETTFLSLVNDLSLRINTGQMPRSLRELSVSDANTREILLTHMREKGQIPL